MSRSTQLTPDRIQELVLAPVIFASEKGHDIASSVVADFMSIRRLVSEVTGLINGGRDPQVIEEKMARLANQRDSLIDLLTMTFESDYVSNSVSENMERLILGPLRRLKKEERLKEERLKEERLKEENKK